MKCQNILQVKKYQQLVTKTIRGCRERDKTISLSHTVESLPFEHHSEMVLTTQTAMFDMKTPDQKAATAW